MTNNGYLHFPFSISDKHSFLIDLFNLQNIPFLILENNCFNQSHIEANKCVQIYSLTSLFTNDEAQSIKGFQ